MQQLSSSEKRVLVFLIAILLIVIAFRYYLEKDKCARIHVVHADRKE